MRHIISAGIALFLSSGAALASHLVEVPVVWVSPGCTGFYIGEGFYVTAGHCVQGDFMLLSDDDSAVLAEVVAFEQPGADRDFAILSSADASPMPGLTLACDTKPHIGDHVSTAGFPGGVGYVAVTGEVASDERPAPPDWEHDIFWIAAPILPGNSGGPVVNEAGEVIGIVVGMHYPSDFVIVQPIDAVCAARATL